MSLVFCILTECVFVRFVVVMHARLHGEEQIEANAKVIVSAKGMLAPITGKERFLTLGTGHCAAFVKAANAGCRTPISYLQDNAGKINVGFLKQQRNYQTMLEQGWPFIQLPWQVETAWPSCPDLLQRALNSSSEVHSPVTELEGAVTIAECLESGDDEASAIAAATSGSPLWSSYARVLAELARRYGGGQHVPLLHKIDGFAKKHGENRRLGEEFLTTVVYSFKYPDPSITLPRVVDMLLTTNMVAPTIVDGVARCITKTDVASLSSKSKLPTLTKVEDHLEHAAELCAHLARRQPSSGDADGKLLDSVENPGGPF